MEKENKNADELLKQIEVLKKLNDEKTDLISLGAHQLRTSLSALKWMLKMFLDNDLGPITPEQYNLIKKAFESNERMIAVVSDILTLNKSEDASIKYQFENIDLVKLIDDVLFDFTEEAHKRNIEIIFFKPEESVPSAFADKEKIRVVIQNLVENALKYSNSPGKIFISMRPQDSVVEISVKDTGLSIQEEDKEHITERFFRANNAKEKEAVGSGLGLFISKTILEHHNGDLHFASTPEDGTTFSITLPYGNGTPFAF